MTSQFTGFVIHHLFVFTLFLRRQANDGEDQGIRDSKGQKTTQVREAKRYHTLFSSPMVLYDTLGDHYQLILYVLYGFVYHISRDALNSRHAYAFFFLFF